MDRAIVLLGWDRPPRVVLREYILRMVTGAPRGRGFVAWQAVDGLRDVELSASWLLMRKGASGLSEERTNGFRGCHMNVSDGALARVLRRLDGAACRSRVVTDFSVARRRCGKLRRGGRRLVFTNGVFDLFHLGHLRLLQAARGLGELLVVGINSDASARRLKGRSRPVVSQFARAEIVAGVRGVDLCVIFPQPDPRQLIRTLRPDVLVKGSEYAPAEVVGRELVEGWGGRVERVAHLPGWSSTGLLRSARR